MSAPKRELEVMTCAQCNRERAWTDGFPTRTYAVCWQCTWEDHTRREHPPSKPPRRWMRVSERERKLLNHERANEFVSVPSEPQETGGEK